MLIAHDASQGFLPWHVIMAYSSISFWKVLLGVFFIQLNANLGVSIAGSGSGRLFSSNSIHSTWNCITNSDIMPIWVLLVFCVFGFHHSWIYHVEWKVRTSVLSNNICIRTWAGEACWYHCSIKKAVQLVKFPLRSIHIFIPYFLCYYHSRKCTQPLETQYKLEWVLHLVLQYNGPEHLLFTK